MTSSPTPKERILADILDELRALRRELQAKPRPVITWMAESHGAHRGPAGEYRVGWPNNLGPLKPTAPTVMGTPVERSDNVARYISPAPFTEKAVKVGKRA